MPINFVKATHINRVAEEALNNILSKRDDIPDMYVEINKIDDLKVAKIVIRRLMEKVNENTVCDSRGSKVVFCKQCAFRNTEFCHLAYWDEGQLITDVEDDDFCSRPLPRDNKK